MIDVVPAAPGLLTPGHKALVAVQDGPVRRIANRLQQRGLLAVGVLAQQASGLVGVTGQDDVVEPFFMAGGIADDDAAGLPPHGDDRRAGADRTVEGLLQLADVGLAAADHRAPQRRAELKQTVV